MRNGVENLRPLLAVSGLGARVADKLSLIVFMCLSGFLSLSLSLSLFHFQRLQRTISHMLALTLSFFTTLCLNTRTRNYLHREIPDSYIVNRVVAEE